MLRCPVLVRTKRRATWLQRSTARNNWTFFGSDNGGKNPPCCAALFLLVPHYIEASAQGQHKLLQLPVQRIEQVGALSHSAAHGLLAQLDAGSAERIFACAYRHATALLLLNQVNPPLPSRKRLGLCHAPTIKPTGAHPPEGSWGAYPPKSRLLRTLPFARKRYAALMFAQS